MNWIEATARWYLILVAITWAFAPFVRWLCGPLADRGATITRPIAVLAALYPAWLLGSLGLAPFTSKVVVAVIIIAGAVGWASVWLVRQPNWCWLKHLAIVEIASMALFGAYVWLRGFTPQILGTEKPMDMAFLASSTRAVSIPPPDPWLAGEPINYYYLGYLLNGTVGRLSGVIPEIGFNLALATIFSMTAVCAFGVACNVVRPWLGARAATAAGIFALFLIAVAGNLYAPQRLLADASGTISAWWWDSVNGIGWRASRIVCDGSRVDNLCPSPSTETINEFPFFSFLLGDLHPHVMALPYTIVVLGLAWNLALNARESAGQANRGWLLKAAIVGAIAGSLYPLNAWDFPTLLLTAAIGTWMGAGATIARSWKPILVVTGSAVVAWLPFFATYVPPAVAQPGATQSMMELIPIAARLLSAVGLHLGQRTSLVEYLTVFGLQFALAIALVLSGIEDNGQSRERYLRTLVMSAAVTIIPGVMLSAPVIPLCGIPLALAVTQLRAWTTPSPRWFALVLVSFAFALSIGVEIFYVRDVFEDRMNTLFKFYYQAWTLYGIAAAITVALLWEYATERRAMWLRWVITAAAILIILAGASYPVVAAYQWTDHLKRWRGLDGLAFAEQTDPDDTAAIRWLGEHAAPGDVVLEAAGCSYLPFDRLPFNRVSAFTGLPTIIGWANNHQRQWRGGQPALIAEIDRREADVAEMYANPASPLIDEYGVTWLFVGEYESEDWQATCRAAGPYDIARIIETGSSEWTLAFQSGETRIYQRSRQ